MSRKHKKSSPAPTVAAGIIALLIGAPGVLGATLQQYGLSNGGLVDGAEVFPGEDEDQGYPGWWEVDDGTPGDPHGPRAHSDVPDLPDGDGSGESGGDQQATSAGHSLYAPPEVPSLDEIITGDLVPLTESLQHPSQPFLDDRLPGSTGVGPAPGAAIPSPGAAIVLGVAGVGLSARRRRR